MKSIKSTLLTSLDHDEYLEHSLISYSKKKPLQTESIQITQESNHDNTLFLPFLHERDHLGFLLGQKQQIQQENIQKITKHKKQITDISQFINKQNQTNNFVPFNQYYWKSNNQKLKYLPNFNHSSVQITKIDRSNKLKIGLPNIIDSSQRLDFNHKRESQFFKNKSMRKRKIDTSLQGSSVNTPKNENVSNSKSQIKLPQQVRKIKLSYELSWKQIVSQLPQIKDSKIYERERNMLGNYNPKEVEMSDFLKNFEERITQQKNVVKKLKLFTRNFDVNKPEKYKN